MGKLKNIKINSIVKPLYDIEVENNHNFIVNNGIVIKNSEQYLDDLGNCNLASINCSKYYDPLNGFNNDKLNIVSGSMCRFLDNVIEMEIVSGRYAAYKQKISLESLRRIGGGITNICGLLLRNNLEYGNEDGNKFIEKFVEKFNFYLYKTSIELGAEKGNFKAFVKEDYCKSPFIKHMMKLGLEFNTMRNVCVSSIAPVGCTIKETIIQTNKGLKSFKEIFEENNVDINELESLNEKKWFDLKEELFAKDINGNYNKITKLYFNGSSTVNILKFDDDSQFTATTNHKVLIIDEKDKSFGIWKELSELKEGDEIIFE